MSERSRLSRRAVMLPAGHWQVEWRYEPASVRVGAILAALALASAAGILIGARHE